MNDNEIGNYDYIFKILLLGDSSVGKTCFLLRYSDDTFTENHISTIGLDYRFKLVNLENDKKVKLQIWDTAGQDRFRAITKNYYKGAHGIILIYDVTNISTFNNIKSWVTQIRENTTEKIKIVLVGNKIDEEELRKISSDEGQKLAVEYDLKFFEASAKKNIRVTEVFNYITEEINIQNMKKEVQDNAERKKNKANTIIVSDEKVKSKKTECCKGGN
jgi:Ras-related protein Rab-8A